MEGQRRKRLDSRQQEKKVEENIKETQLSSPLTYATHCSGDQSEQIFFLSVR